MVRGKGQRGPEADRALAAAAQVDAVGATVGQEFVPQLHAGQVHGAEGAAATHSCHKAGKLFLELVEASHDNVARSTG